MEKLINAVGFQAGWWACIAGIGRGWETEAIAFCAMLVCLHLYFSTARSSDLKLAFIALLVGISADSLLQYTSVIDFYGWALGPLSPFWLWMLWVLFALTLNSSLAFLKNQSRITVAILGLIFGPLTYYAGAKMGAAALDATPLPIFSLAIVWMLAMPLLVMAAEGTSHPPEDNL